MSRLKIVFLKFTLLLCLIQCSTALTEGNPIVSTTLGLIRGYKADDGDYNMFMGIPFAKVNSANPFGKAIPQEPFDGIFDAYDDSAICPQIEEFNHTIVGDLDCLHLNIYTPTTANADNPKPVMVMIFGGAFALGFAGRFLYGPKYLVRHDVVFVTLNYRLGPYGFMCSGTRENPGNEGLKDQLQALRWIKENIQAFGGDPNKITAYGHSAGGGSVDFQMVSKHEKLFDQIILMSGSILGPLYGEPNRNAPLMLAEHLGHKTDDINEAITFLATRDSHEVILATSELNLGFGPCIEREFEGVESILTFDWMEAPIPKAEKMPIMLGISNNEALATVNTPEEMFSNGMIRDLLVPGFKIDDPRFEGMDGIVYRFYMGDRDITKEHELLVTDFISDFWFKYPMFKSVAKYLANGAGDMYFYQFSYVGERNFIRHRENITVGGAAHGDELGYLYDFSYFDTPNEADQLIIDRMTTLWTNFAKFGNPLPVTTELLPLEWAPITKDSKFNYLEIDTVLTTGTRPFHERMTFWELFYKANAEVRRRLQVPEPDSPEEPNSALFLAHNLVLIAISLITCLVNH